MVSKTQAGTLAAVSIVLAASSAALAQYPASDPRSNIYNNESLRRQDEIRRNEEAAKTQQQYDDARGSSNSRPASSSYDPRAAAELQALRKKLLGRPPLPDERNTLLGRWRVESSGKPKRKDEMGLLMGMLANPGGAACQFMFGEGIVEFKSKTWASIDGFGDDSLGPIAYRSDGKRLFALPAKGIEIMGFDVVNPNRIEVFNLAGCALNRVTGTTTTQSGVSSRAPAASAVGTPPPPGPASSTASKVAAAAPSSPPSTLARPSPEVCRNTLLDKLGVVGVSQVRAMSDVRFKEPAIEGKVPNSNNLRLDLRGSACDDPRVKATLYDFDANEMLQAITFVWDRPPGPAPAPIFQERVYALSRVNPGGLPPPQSSGRLQADTIMGRLILQDMPERNLLLEAYKTKK
jgi:hypothetical protein